MLPTSLHYQLINEIHPESRSGLKLRQKIMLAVGLVFILSKAYVWVLS